MEVDKVMQILKSARTHQWNVRRGLISSRIANTFSSANNSSNNKRVALWSATTLAFLIAPLAALVWSGGPSDANGVNLVSTSSNSGDATTQPDSNGVQTSLSTESAQNNNSTSIGNADSASVRVDGEDIDVPDNGNVNRIIKSDDGQVTHVNISSTNTSSGDKQTTRSNLRVSTHTNSQTNTKSSQ